MFACGDPHSGPPRIVGQPINQTIPAGESAIFGVQAQGKPPLNYQWRKNGQDLYAATFPNYAAPAATAADNGAKFDVVITNSLGSVTSNPVMLTVKIPPAPPPPPPAKKKKTTKRARRRHRK
jgi:hypothetical protein